VTAAAAAPPAPAALPSSPAAEVPQNGGRDDRLDFELPPELEAAEPAEVRGRARDDVRLLVAERSTGRIGHHHVTELPSLLRAGDLLVVNTSATVAASLPATTADGEARWLHVSTALPQDLWLVELRLPAGAASKPYGGGEAGDRLTLPDGAAVVLLARTGSRLWVARLELPPGTALLGLMAGHGRPIRYGYVTHEWPLTAYQNVYATEPGSAEMPSAGRALTTGLITRLVAAGIDVAPLVLHTGVSSLEAGESPYPERYRVPADTARRVNGARAGGGRVIAVGTTPVRALETVVDDQGRVHPGEGWTDVVVTPQRGVSAVDGLLTGWHEPKASHLAMLEAVAGRPLLEASYAAAVADGYRWHEFGDLHLLLP
jgi:S-adenosylmethionine:tRNA ribosyltransferase-isomerase